MTSKPQRDADPHCLMVAYNAPGWDNDESETLVNNSDEANNEINYRNFDP